MRWSFSRGKYCTSYKREVEAGKQNDFAVGDEKRRGKLGKYAYYFQPTKTFSGQTDQPDSHSSLSSEKTLNKGHLK